MFAVARGVGDAVGSEGAAARLIGEIDVAVALVVAALVGVVDVQTWDDEHGGLQRRGCGDVQLWWLLPQMLSRLANSGRDPRDVGECFGSFVEVESVRDGEFRDMAWYCEASIYTGSIGELYNSRRGELGASGMDFDGRLFLILGDQPPAAEDR